MNLSLIIIKWIEVEELIVNHSGRQVSIKELATNSMLLESVFISVESKLHHVFELDLKIQHKNDAWMLVSGNLSAQFLTILMMMKELQQKINQDDVLEL